MKPAFLIAALVASSAASAQVVIDGSADQELASGIVAALDKHLRDPLSVQLRRVRPSSEFGAEVACGEINRTNEYGGYVGFQPFFADLADAVGMIASDDEAGAYAALAPAMGC